MRDRSASINSGNSVKKEPAKKKRGSHPRFGIKIIVLVVLSLLVTASMVSMIPADGSADGTNEDGPLAAPWNGSVAAGFAGGTGTSASPYEITNGEQLAYLRQAVNSNLEDTVNGGLFRDAGKHYILTADIELNIMTLYNIWSEGYAPRNKWIPIGTVNSFSGHFDGAGHVIKGIYISTTNHRTGLFGDVSGGTIVNIGIEKSYIKGDTSIGGIVGRATDNSTISNCYNSGKVSGTDNIGGIAGSLEGGSQLLNSYNTGPISSTGTDAGGLVGNTGAIISNSFNTGAVNGNSNVGGVAGNVIISGAIYNSYSIGFVKGSGGVGGVAGASTGTVSHSYYSAGFGGTGAGLEFTSSGIVTQGTYSGSSLFDALGTWISTTTILPFSGFTYSSWTGNPYPTFGTSVNPEGVWNGTAATGTPALVFAGGTGTSTDPYLIANGAQLAYMRVEINANRLNTVNTFFKLTKDIFLNDSTTSNAWTPIGTTANPFRANFDGDGHEIIGVRVNSDTNSGLFNRITGGKVTNLGVVDISLTGTGERKGGIAANLYGGGLIENCYVSGSIAGTDNYRGGIVGVIQNSTVRNSYSSATITGGYDYNGGIAGGIYGTLTANRNLIENCYNTGNVSGRAISGGIVGVSYESTAVIRNCYNTGNVTSSGSYSGGIVGWFYGSTIVRNCYNAGTVTASNYAGGITGNITGGSLASSYNSGIVNSSGSSVGGIAGSASNSNATFSYFSAASVSNGRGLGGTATNPSVISFNASEVLASQITVPGQLAPTDDVLTALNAWVINNGVDNFHGYEPATEGSGILFRFAPITEVSVTFDLNGGTGVLPAKIEKLVAGSRLHSVLEPVNTWTKTGYLHYDGWYQYDGIDYHKFIFGSGGTRVNEDITLYLNWRYAEINIVQSSLSNGTFSDAYSQTLTTTIEGNAGGDVIYSVSEGSLPSGLTLDGSTGTISGIPSAAGTYTFKIKAENTVSGVPTGATDEEQYTVVIAPKLVTSGDPLLSIGAIAPRTYTGLGITPTPAVIYNGNTLAAPADFSYSYANNINAGPDADVIIIFTGNYTGSVVRQFVIEKAVLEVTADDKTRVYNDHNPPFTATVTGFVNGETVSVLSNRNFSITTLADTTSDIGPYEITIAVGSASAQNYSFEFVHGELTITPLRVTVPYLLHPTMTSFTYNASPHTLDIWYDHTWSSVSGNTETAVGSYTAQVSLTNPNTVWDHATYVRENITFTWTIDPATMTLGAADVTVTYDGNAHTIFITGTVAGDVITYSDDDVAYTGTHPTCVNAGTYTIWFKVERDQYLPFTGSALVIINKKALTVTADNETRVYYDDNNPSFTATVTGFVSGEDETALTNSDFLITTLAGKTSNVGDHEITITVGNAAAQNYSFVFVNGKLTITPLKVTPPVFTPPLVDFMYDGSEHELDVVNDTYWSNVTGNKAVLAGNYQAYVSLKYPGNTVWDDGTDSTDNISFSWRIMVSWTDVTAANINVTYDGVSRSITVNYTHAVDNIEYMYDAGSGYSTTNPSFKDAGTYTIWYQVTRSGETQGGIAQIVIHKKDLTIIADDVQKVFGENPDPPLTFTESGWVGTEELDGLLSGDLIRTIGENAGTYTIGRGNLEETSGNYNIVFTPGIFTITQKALTVTVAPNQTKVYGSPNPSLYTYTLSDTSAQGAVTGILTRASGEDVNTYLISQGSLSAGPNYTITFNSDVFTITPKDLFITVDPGQEKVYGSSDPLPFTYDAVGLMPWDTISGSLSRDTGEDVGTYNIISDPLNNPLSAGPNYTLHFTGDVFTITPKDLFITVDPGQEKVYGSPDPLPFTYDVDGLETGDTISGSLSRDTGDDVGTYDIISNPLDPLSAGSNYTLHFTGDVFTITPKALTITVDPGQSKVYGSSDPLPFAYTLSEPLAAGNTMSGSLVRVAGENVGTYIIYRDTLDPLSAGPNYTVTFIGGVFTITQKTLTITPNPNQGKVYGQPDPSLYYAEVGLISPDIITGNLTRVSGNGVGTYDIEQGSLYAGPNYDIVFTTGVKFEITPAPLTVTPNSGQSKVYGTADPPLTYTLSVPLAPGNSITGALERDDNTNGNVGMYEILQGTLSAGSNYAITFTPGIMFRITPAELTVTPHPGQSKVYDTADPVLDYTLSPLGVPVIGELARDGGDDVGMYEITEGTLSAGANYTITFITGVMFEITKAPLTVTPDSGQSKVYGETDPVLTYTESPSGVPFTGELVRDRVTDEGVGMYEILQGTLSAGPNYDITFVTGVMFEITQKVLSNSNVDIGALSSQRYTSNPITQTVTVKHNNETLQNTVDYSVAYSPNVNVGTVTVTITFGGNYSGSAATTFQITPAPLTITVTPGQNKQAGDNDPLTFSYTEIGWLGTYSKAGLLIGELVRESGEDAGTYVISQGTLRLVPFGSNPDSNYEIKFTVGTFEIKAVDEPKDWIIIVLMILAVLTALLMILLFAYVRYRVTGHITSNGRGLEDVTVEYIMNGKPGTTVTDENGHYMIRALAGAELEITDVVKEGYAVSGKMPEPFIVEKAAMADFVMREV